MPKATDIDLAAARGQDRPRRRRPSVLVPIAPGRRSRPDSTA